MSDALNRLINPWQLTITVNGEDRMQHFPPLIDMLHNIVGSSNNNRGGGGLPSTRNMLDTKALDLLINIEDVTRAWLQEWEVGGTGDLKADLTLFEHAVQLLDETEHGALRDRLAAYPDQWAARIWDLIEPPLQRRLRDTECPKCGRAKWVNENEEHNDNLTITHRPGQEVTAECSWVDCGAVWVGQDGLKALGRQIGVEFDTSMLETEGAD